ncbi:MAG: hypothetical protein ACTSR7_12625 [Promethearchaeota archaeon]
MSEEMKGIIDASYDNFIPLWLYNKEYIYGMISADPDGLRWIEVSYSFEEEEEPLFKNERNADLSYKFLLEEIIKAVPYYVEDYNVNKIKDYTKSIEAKSSTDKIKELISELINNSSNYSTDLPIIKKKEDIGKLKEKL